MLHPQHLYSACRYMYYIQMFLHFFYTVIKYIVLTSHKACENVMTIAMIWDHEVHQNWQNLLERVIVKSSLNIQQNRPKGLMFWMWHETLGTFNIVYVAVGLSVMSCGSSVFQVLKTNLSQLCCIHNFFVVYIIFPYAGTLHILEMGLILTVHRPIQCIQACISHNCVTT